MVRFGLIGSRNDSSLDPRAGAALFRGSVASHWMARSSQAGDPDPVAELDNAVMGGRGYLGALAKRTCATDGELTSSTHS
jgi:hypothetical protein